MPRRTRRQTARLATIAAISGTLAAGVPIATATPRDAASGKHRGRISRTELRAQPRIDAHRDRRESRQALRDQLRDLNLDAN